MTMLRVLLGPEGYWLLIVMACGLLARLNVPATARGNELLVLGAQWLPVFAVPLLFWLAFKVWPRGDTSWAWTVGRLWLATLVGLNLAAYLLLMTVDYGDSRNAGVGMAPVAVTAYGTLIFIACTLVSALTLTPWGWKTNVLVVAGGGIWLLVLLVMIGAGARTLAWLWAAAPVVAIGLRYFILR